MNWQDYVIKNSTLINKQLKYEMLIDSCDFTETDVFRRDYKKSEQVKIKLKNERTT